MWGLFPQEKQPRSIKLHFLHLIWQSRSNRNNEISFTTSLLQGCPTYPLKSKRWEIICPRLWQGHCSRLTKEYSNFIEWKATQSKQTPKPLSRHPSPAGLLLSPPSRAPAIQGKCVFPTLELSSRVCPAGVLPRGERGDGLEVTSTHIPLRHVTSSPPVALALLASSSEPERLRRGGQQKVKQSCSPSAHQEYEDFKSFTTHGVLKPPFYIYSELWLLQWTHLVDEGQRRTYAFNKHRPDKRHAIITHCLFHMMHLTIKAFTFRLNEKERTNKPS